MGELNQVIDTERKVSLCKVLVLAIIIFVGSVFIYSCDSKEGGDDRTSDNNAPVEIALKLGVLNDHSPGFHNVTGLPADAGIIPPGFVLPSGDPDYAWHRPGPQQPYTNNCTVCHGTDLTGGAAWTDEDGKSTTPPSCTACHGVIWMETTSRTPPVFSAPSDHTASNRERMHKPVVLNNPFFVNNYATTSSGSSACTVCHGDGTGSYLGGGPTYNGTTPPACSVCHGPRWTDDIGVPPPIFSPPADHATSMRGRAHKTDVDINQAYDNCAECHGRTLSGEAKI